MDSDIEIDIDFLQSRDGAGPEARRWLTSRKTTHKLMEDEINKVLRMHFTGCMSSAAHGGDSNGAICSTQESEHKHYCTDAFGVFHINRLFRTVSGFHTGSLDLAGRFPDRYNRVKGRMDALVKDVTPFPDGASEEEILTKIVEALEASGGEELGLPWAEAVKKWHLGTMVDLNAFMDYWETTELIIAASPLPRFQTLCLTDLPPEIIDRIMEHSSPGELRVWCMTCRLLRERALYYAYEALEYEMTPKELERDRLRSEPIGSDHFPQMQEYIRGIAMGQRDAILHRMRHAMGQPSIARQIRRLAFVETWTSTRTRSRLEPFSYMDHMGISYHDMFTPVFELLVDHLRSSPVDKLVYQSRFIYAYLWDAISESANLRHLDLVTNVPTDTPWPLAPNVVNLHLTIFNTDDHPDRLWNIAYSCPSTLFLHVRDPFRYMVYIPRALSSADGRNIMTHVRRLDLQDVIADTLINLVTAILVAGTIPLTHLAISATVSRIKRAIALVLADSLRNAPNLAALRLSGLHFVDPVFFALLGQCVPNLRQLVIEYKPGILLSKSYPKAPWPFPSYCYAPLFAAFPYLEHLGLNIPIVDVSCTSKYLARMESGYQDMPSVEEGDLGQDSSGTAVDCVAMEGARAMARLFAVYAPRLRTIFFEQVALQVWNSAWAIDRDPNGRPLPRRDLTRKERSRGMTCGSFRWAADWEFSEKELKEILRGASTPSSI